VLERCNHTKQVWSRAGVSNRNAFLQFTDAGRPLLALQYNFNSFVLLVRMHYAFLFNLKQIHEYANIFLQQKEFS